MSFVGNLGTFFSQSFLSKMFNNLLTWAKPLRYAIEDVFEFLFGSSKTKNTHRLLFCVGFGMLCFRLFRFIYRTAPIVSKLATYQYNRTNFSKLKFKERYGVNSWAFITGFTEGIGYAFARELAKLRFNLVVVNKNDGRIDSTVRWLKQINPTIQIKVIELDFKNEPQKIYEELYNKTADLDIGIVINNVGMTAGGDYLDLDRNKILDTITVNFNSQVEVSRVFLPRFKQRASRSAFINMASCSGFFPCPRLGIYSASKTMNDIFSRSILFENSGYGIDVLTLRPFGVSTGMIKMGKGRLVVTPQQLAESALLQLGHIDTSFGPLKHKIGGIVFSSMSEAERFDRYESQFKTIREKR